MKKIIIVTLLLTLFVALDADARSRYRSSGFKSYRSKSFSRSRSRAIKTPTRTRRIKTQPKVVKKAVAPRVIRRVETTTVIRQPQGSNNNMLYGVGGLATGLAVGSMLNNNNSGEYIPVEEQAVQGEVGGLYVSETAPVSTTTRPTNNAPINSMEYGE